MYRPLLEEMIDFAMKEGDKEALQEIRNTFFTATGEIFDDDPSFETRLAIFVEWYVLDYREYNAQTWAERFLVHLPIHERKLGTQLASSHRSLLTATKLHSWGLALSDLIGGAKFHVAGEIPPGLRRGDIFEGRVIPWKDNLLLSRSLIFHPYEAKAIIKRHVVQALLAKESREDILARLGRMRLRFDRYHKIPLEKIYDHKELFGR